MRPIGPPAPLAVPVALPALLLAALALIAGCGSADEQALVEPRGELPPPSESARIAIAGPFESVDPLYAEGRAERLLSRQIYDPLVARLSPPLGELGKRRGPARPLNPPVGESDWTFELRPGARFQDGTPIDADAVIANSRRWFASGLAAEVIPELDAVDTPLPGQVRFQLSAPVPDLPARLSDLRFGLVSPQALIANGLGEVPDGAGGSGAYEALVLTEGRAVLESAGEWWGRAAGLGPGIDRIDFLATESPVRRLGLLSDGVVEIADDLDRGAAELIARQPLLVAAEQGEMLIGASGAVRGLRGGAVEQPLSEIWLTTLRSPE